MRYTSNADRVNGGSPLSKEKGAFVVVMEYGCEPYPRIRVISIDIAVSPFMSVASNCDRTLSLKRAGCLWWPVLFAQFFLPYYSINIRYSAAAFPNQSDKLPLSKTTKRLIYGNLRVTSCELVMRRF